VFLFVQFNGSPLWSERDCLKRCRVRNGEINRSECRFAYLRYKGSGSIFPQEYGGKISTLKPFTSQFFAVLWLCRKRGAKNDISTPFPSAPFYGKTGNSGLAATVAFAVALPPRPRPPLKSKN